MSNYGEKDSPARDRSNKGSKDPKFNVTENKDRDNKNKPSQNRNEQKRHGNQPDKKKAS